ncbi:MAG TPA: hypothetical protein ENJ33_07110 [Thiothrix sp.]|nr:hypothetical protein [Thiothrix sp.]
MNDATIELLHGDMHDAIQDKNQRQYSWETSNPRCVKPTLKNDLNDDLLDIAKKYHLPLKKIQKLLHPQPTSLPHSDVLACCHCYSPYQPKNSHHYKAYNAANVTHWICPTCKGSLLEGEAQKKYAMLSQRFHQALQEAPLTTDLSFIDALFLIAIINNSHNDVGCEIRPQLLASHPLAPTDELSGMMYAHLLRKNIIVVSPDSNLAFVDYSKSLYYQWNKVSWLITAQGNHGDLSEVIAACYAHLVNRKWSGHDFDEVQFMCETVWSNEALCYIRYLGQRNCFEVSEDDYLELSNILVALLRQFPLTKINVLLWRTAKFAQRFYFENNGDQQATNQAFIERLEINSHIALYDNGTIHGDGFARQDRVVGSTLSSLLFNDILHEKQFGHYKLLGEII